MILNYAVTSNHIHLIVVGGNERDVIPNSIKLIAGRTGQEFNQRKNRKGAFWEDRYHATAIESGDLTPSSHSFRTMVWVHEAFENLFHEKNSLETILIVW